MANLSLLDWALRLEPDGAAADVLEMLSQCNEILNDIVWTEANATDGHMSILRTALPVPAYRTFNAGVPGTVSKVTRVKDKWGMLYDWSYLDKALAETTKDQRKLRLMEDQAHIEGMAQKISYDLFYQDQATTPAAFTGLASRYGALTAYASGKNIINGGGSGSSNSSIWLLGWSPDSIHGFFPQGSVAGMVYKDWGDLVPLKDASGNEYPGYRSSFEWKVGLATPDWRWGVRICNLDTTSAGLKGVAPFDIYAGLSAAVNAIPNMGRISGINATDDPRRPSMAVKGGIYMNRLVRTAADIQAIRDRNVLLTPAEYAGFAVTNFRGIPLRVVDSIINAESTVS